MRSLKSNPTIHPVNECDVLLLSESRSGFALTMVQFRATVTSLSAGHTTTGSRARSEGASALSVCAVFISTEWHAKLPAAMCSLLGESNSMRNNTMEQMNRAEVSVFCISNILPWPGESSFLHNTQIAPWDICGSQRCPCRVRG